MKKWLDNYGKKENANEGHSSASKEWIGEGYSNIGRNYSPAWGGQFQNGGSASSNTTTPTKYKWSVNDPIPVVYATKDMVGVGMRDIKYENELAIKTKAQAEKALKEEQQKASMKQQASLSADRVPNFGPEKEKADAIRRERNGQIAASNPDKYKYNYTTGDLIIKENATPQEWRDASFVSTPELVQTAAQLTPSGRDYVAGEAGAQFFVNAHPWIAPITATGRLASQSVGQNPYGVDYSDGLTLDNALGTGMMGLDLIMSKAGLSPGLQTLTEPIVEDLANIAGKVKSGVVNAKQAYAPPSYPFGRNLKKGKDWMQYVAAPEVQNRFGFTSSEASDWLEDFIRRKTGKTISEIDVAIQANPSRALRYERLVHDELFGNTGEGRYHGINAKIDDAAAKFKTWGNYLTSTSPLKGAKDIFNNLDLAAGKAIKFNPGSIESIVKEANRILAEGVGIKKTDVDVSLNLTSLHKGHSRLDVKINDPNLGWVDLGYIELKSNTTFEPATLSNKIKQLLGKPMSSATTARIEKGFTKEMDFPTEYQTFLNSKGVAYDYNNIGIGAEAHQAIKQAAEKYNTSLLSSTGHSSGTRTSGSRNPNKTASGEVRYLREYLNGRLQGVSDEQHNPGWEQKVKDYMKTSGKTKWTTHEVELLLDSDPTLAPSGIRFKYEEGGIIPQAQNGYTQPTRADSIALLNNTNALLKYYNEDKYKPYYDPSKNKMRTPIKNPVYFNDAEFKQEVKAFNSSLNDGLVYVPGKNSSEIAVPGKNVPSDVFYKPVDKNKYYRREYQNRILDTRAPMQLIDKRIKPHSSMNLWNYNRDDIMYSDGVLINLYEPLATTPWDMLKPNEQKERLKKYGVTGTPYADPNYKPEPQPSLKKKVTKMEPIPSKSKPIDPELRTIQHPNIQSSGRVPEGHYIVEYFDPELKQETHRMFMTQAESDAFAKELGQRNLHGVPAAGNITQRVQYQNGGDSLLLYKNQLLKDEFYRNNPNYKSSPHLTNSQDITSNKDIPNIIKDIKEGVLKHRFVDYTFTSKNFKKPVTEKHMTDRFRKISNNVYSAGDLLTHGVDTWFNPDAPPSYFSDTIKPQKWMHYDSDNLHDSTDVPIYDPLAIKPYDIRTPEEKIEWEERYGKKPPEPTLNKKVTHVDPISSNRSITPGLRSMQHPNIKMSGRVPQGDWNVEYFNPNSKKTEVKHFITNEDAEKFYNDPANKASRKYSNTSSVGRMQLGGSVYPVNYVPQAQDGLTFLEPTSPKLPIGYANIPTNIPSSELAQSIGGEDGEPAFLIPTFKYGHPLEDPDAEFRKTGEHLGGPFKTWQEADTWDREIRHPYVEKGQDIPTPLRRWGKDFAMGGSIPGSAGFTYARTNSPAPSNGPYAKKTKASAQRGKKVPVETLIDPKTNPTYAEPIAKSLQYMNDWMNSPKYKEMLENSLTGGKNMLKIMDRRRKSVIEDGKINYYEEPMNPRTGAQSEYTGKGKSNVYINPDSMYSDLNNDILHELSHVTDAGGLGIPLRDQRLMRKYATHDIKDSPLYENYKESGKVNDLKRFTYYVNTPTETRARLNNLRSLMRDQNVYDPFTQSFSKDMFDKYKQLDINEEDKKRGQTVGMDPYQQLRMTYTDEEIEDMMNKISKNDDNDVTPIAQNGDKYSKNKKQVIDQLSNLPIYSPDQRYSEYQSNIQDWTSNVRKTPVEVNYSSPAQGSSYYGHSAPFYDSTFPYQGTIQLDDRQFDNVQTPDRVIGHELRHAAFDSDKFIPQWMGDALYNTARNPNEFEQGAHQNKLRERASMLVGARQNALDELGLPANSKLSEDQFNYWARQPLETALRTGRIPDQYNDVKETFSGARNARDVRNLINFENIPSKENGGMTYYQHGLDWKPKSMETGGWLDKYVPEAQNGAPISPKDFTLQYIKSPKYKERLTKGGYNDVDAEIKRRYNSVNDTNKIITQSGPSGFIDQLKGMIFDEPYNPYGGSNADMKNTIYYDPEQAKKIGATKDETVAHEFSHKETMGDDKKIYLNDRDIKELTGRLNPTAKKQIHDARADENKGDMNAVRYWLHNNGVDVYNRDITPEELKKAKASGKFTSNRLFKNYSDADLLWLLNNVAKNESSLKNMDVAKQGGVIKDDRGQWDHPGEITEIGSNRITMQGVPYPVLGISDTGDQQMMYPGEEYEFKGKKVTEFPITQKVSKKENGGWLSQYK